MIVTMNIESTLQAIGLSEKEIDVYLALLPRAQAPASVLAKQLGIPRSTAKFTCDQLLKKQLVQTKERHHTTYYIPEPPQKLLYLFERREQELQESREELERVMYHLQNIHNPEAQLPFVQLYEGKQEIEGMLLELMEKEGERYCFSGGEHIAKLLPVVMEKAQAELKKKKLVEKTLRPLTDKKKYKKDAQTKFFAGIEEQRVHIVIVDDTVSITSIAPSANTGIKITHPEIAQALAAIFKDVWEKY